MVGAARTLRFLATSSDSRKRLVKETAADPFVDALKDVGMELAVRKDCAGVLRVRIKRV